MGGNVFKDTEPFDHSKIDKIVNIVKSTVKDTGVELIHIGSTANPTPGQKSGDLDMLVDETALGRYFDEKTPRTIRVKLAQLVRDHGLTTTRNGIAVHVKVPVDGAAHQVDLIVVPNAVAVSKLHLHKIPKGSKFKGVGKQLAFQYLAKQQNLAWNAFQGLYARDSEGKATRLIAQDLSTISYVLLGVNSTESDLDCLETIMAAMPEADAKTMLDTITQYDGWKDNA